MAKWLKLNFGTRRDPPQPPRPDYSESEILRAYRAQKELDFEDPYQHTDKEHQNGGFTPCSAKVSLPSFPAFGSVLPNSLEVWNAFFYCVCTSVPPQKKNQKQVVNQGETLIQQSFVYM